MEPHGRLKVKSTAEQQEAKRKEREKKLQIYKTTVAKIFEKRKNGELDQEMLILTGELLAVNPDYYTLWNIRRELMESWSSSKSADEMTKVYSDELYFLEQCLRVNPKSYGTWHQRQWIMDRINLTAKWIRELSLCSTYLEYDERNFHCWDYRRFVVQRADIKPADELQFTSDKIGANFSNFSSWHYRSKLLPLVYSDPSHVTGVDEKTLLNEFELVQNAFFTDPNDQSAWFYHRWLLGQGQQHLAIADIFARKSDETLMVSLTRPAQMGTDFTFHLDVGGIDTDVKWHSASGMDSCDLWIGDLSKSNLGDVTVETSLVLNLTHPDRSTSNSSDSDQFSFTFITGDDDQKFGNRTKTKFCQELSAATTETLSKELESCQQLHELEPDNKWVLLTMLSLMRALDPVRYSNEMVEYISKLVVIDPMRSNYYGDLKSTVLMEIAIETQLSTGSHSFSLSSIGLTVISHSQFLYAVRSVDLSNNSLNSVLPLYHLQSVQQLNLSGNRISSCRGLHRLPQLENVDLRNNVLCQLEDVEMLSECPRLTAARLDGNPVVNVLCAVDKKPFFKAAAWTTSAA